MELLLPVFFLVEALFDAAAFGAVLHLAFLFGGEFFSCFATIQAGDRLIF